MPFRYDSPGLENLDEINRLLAQSPTYQAALRGEWRSPDLPPYADVNSRGYREQNLRMAAKADGFTIPGGVIDAKTGKVGDPNRERWYNSPAFWGPVAVGASGGIAALAANGSSAGASGGAAAAGGGGGAGTGGAAAGGAAAGGGAGAGTGAAVGGTAGASLLHSLLPSLITGATGVAGTYIAAKGNKDAAKTQAESADKALAVQKEMWDLERADLAPYRALGVGGVNNLAYLGGVTMPPPASTAAPQTTNAAPAPAPATAPQNAPQGSLSAYAPSSPQAGMVTVRSPNGQIGQIPAANLTKALQAGAVQV